MLCQFSVKQGRRGTGFGVACHFKTGCRMSVVLAERDQWHGRDTVARDAKWPASPAVRPVRCWLAFVWVLPIAVLSGLIGLGGAECRLPLLAGPLRHSLRDAVPINPAVSLGTLASALAVRLPFFSLAPLHPFVPAIAAVTLGAIVAVSAAGTAVIRLTETRLAKSVLGLLLLIGLVLLSAALLPPSVPAVVPETVSLQLMTGLALGLAVGTSAACSASPVAHCSFRRSSSPTASTSRPPEPRVSSSASQSSSLVLLALPGSGRTSGRRCARRSCPWPPARLWGQWLVGSWSVCSRLLS